MDRLRDLRGADTRERDLANILGFEHSRAVRWKEGQMYVDRAEYLVRLADALEVDTMLLVQLVSGAITVEQAQRMVQRAGRAAGEDGKKRKGGSGHAAVAAPARGAEADVAADAAEYAVNAGQFESATRGIVSSRRRTVRVGPSSARRSTATPTWGGWWRPACRPRWPWRSGTGPSSSSWTSGWPTFTPSRRSV